MFDKNISALAARQYGLVSTAQLLDLGVTHQAVAYRARTGRLHRVHRGVYLVGHRTLVPNARWLAAVLASGPTARLSHRAALALWSLGPRPSGPVDVTVQSAGGRRSPKGIRLHYSRSLHPDDTTTLSAIPVTSVARTLLDYSQTATANQIRTALEAAERLERLDASAIHALIARSPGKPTTELRDALNEITDEVPWTASHLERHFLELVREAGLPEPQVNMSVTGRAADCYWPTQRLVIEIDSWLWHRTRAQFEEDRRRDVARALHGIRTARFTQRRMHRERTRVQAELRALLTDPNLL